MFRQILFGSALFAITAVAVAQGKNDGIEDAVRDDIRDELGLDDKQTGPGRPDNPGEHGRDNAAEKQRQNPGKGSKGEQSWEDRLRDEIDDDHKDKDKDKDKDKKKDKNKNGKNKN